MLSPFCAAVPMRMRWLARTGLISLMLLALASCGEKKSKVEGVPLSGDPQPGALYSLNDGEGGFRVGKVVAVEDNAIFIHLYGKRWTSRPTLAEAKVADKPTPLAYSPETFTFMQPLHLEDGTVSAEELKAYESWRRSKRAVF